MQIDVDVSGRKVVVFGSPSAARRAVTRFVQSGARVTLVLPGAVPPAEQRQDGVRYASQPAGDDTSALLRLVGPAWSVVVVDVDPAVRDRLVELCGRLRVLVQRESPAPTEGQVVLVGGGPGDPGLLTVEACRALGEADVVFFDRLAPTAALAQLAPGAELVDVGKSPYHHPVTQRSIEELMIARAQAGQSVVRLKGGDPFVFGRGGEELLACLAAGVDVRVVPGVSSALAVPAASGIPVTHRGVSHAVTVISGHVPPRAAELDALVRLGGTIVVLMGIATLEQIVAGLCAAGMDASVPAAVVERGYSPSQRSTFTTVGRLPAEVRRLDLRSPAVVVIGEVVTVATSAPGAIDLEAADPFADVEEAPRR
ncbi:uroporphyrinogen-III C-methyltransferase [uncultured Friedmanniella sp.]|uniref:uroporphyrinogen-III C-methyltransferase n=1 Tax=uncultured Friedmanniella sp. TaxID=335381 RepID=UPI0035CB456A